MMKTGMHYKFGGVEFWAEHGAVAMLDIVAAEKANSSEDLIQYASPRDFMKRAIAAFQIRSGLFNSENQSFRRMLEEAQAVYKEASRKPDPFTATGRKQTVVDNKPVQVTVPGAKYRFKKQTPRETFLNGFETEIIPRSKKIIIP